MDVGMDVGMGQHVLVVWYMSFDGTGWLSSPSSRSDAFQKHFKNIFEKIDAHLLGEIVDHLHPWK